MRRVVFLFLTLLFTCSASFGAHLKGGWIQYIYIGPGTTANSSIYQVTVRQYLACNSSAGQRDPDIYLGIFDGATNNYIKTITINLSGTTTLNKGTYSPCLSTRPQVCYIIDIYSQTIELPNTTSGYTLAVQRCCRITGIVNLQAPSDDYGLTYTATIPGTINGVDYFRNSNPVFAQKDTVIVCYNSHFTLDFSATDNDGDVLTYSFCSGLTGGFNNRSNPSDPAAARPNPPSSPPFSAISYSGGYSGGSPMGNAVSIDPKTGIISGIAPGVTGDYVISVCASEYRNGVFIGSTKKEIHVAVADCSVSGAVLKPSYVTCNSTSVSFQNESTSSNIISYLWDFGVPNLTNDTSSNPTPVYDYIASGKDSGTYTVSLKVTGSGGCQDSTTSVVKVYPGFVPGFSVKGSCYLNNYLFSDTSTIKYGVVNSRRWDFGDASSTADTATSKDTAWKYPSAVTAQVRLIVGNNVGCIDTLIQSVQIMDKPSLQLPFHDTLICSNDTLALKANTAAGTLLWTPSAGPNRSRILNDTSHSPLVFPRDTTRYYVVLTDNGCTNMDSVNVNVLQFISVDAGPDTAICRTDTIQLKPVSYALSYQWTASTGESVQNVKNPLVRPLAATRYVVIANLGKCQARDSLQVTVVPYPSANAGPDQTICYGSRVQLNATMTGTKFSWTPTSSLINANTLNPVAGPDKTTAYVFAATDTVGCPRPKYDTVIVTVIPRITAYAGRDTFAFPNQPLQLQASGGTSYSWRPASWLNNEAIYNPVATIDGSVDSITYTVRVSDAGCYADAKVKVRIYKSGADIFVPSAFTPNGDGKNDVIKPTLIGIVKLNSFSVYNRWGQLMFSTTQENKGWNGVFNGLPQPSGAYVYQASGVDLSGKLIYRKGTVVLIR